MAGGEIEGSLFVLSVREEAEDCASGLQFPALTIRRDDERSIVSGIAIGEPAVFCVQDGVKKVMNLPVLMLSQMAELTRLHNSAGALIEEA